MIDLHCHLLPGIDDGAGDLEMALAMARMATNDGIETVACTPHILPGVYDNSRTVIEEAVARLAAELDRAGVPLRLTIGADVHISPHLLQVLQSGMVPTIADSRYFLLEPPDQVLPPRMSEFVFGLIAAGYVPILTHPERLNWIESHFGLLKRLAAGGALIQITAGSFLGRFGRRALYWSERMLSEGMVDLVASDAHNTDHRPPRLAPARDAIAARSGNEVATSLVTTNPLCILENVFVPRLHQRGIQTASAARPER